MLPGWNTNGCWWNDASLVSGPAFPFHCPAAYDPALAAGRADRAGISCGARAPAALARKLVCPGLPASHGGQHAQWARAHLAMLAQEMVDAMAFSRLGRSGGPTIDLQGAEFAKGLARQGKGFILVLNHYDRLLTAPVALAREGIATNVLTMPVLDNPELEAAQRRFC